MLLRDQLLDHVGELLDLLIFLGVPVRIRRLAGISLRVLRLQHRGRWLLQQILQLFQFDNWLRLTVRRGSLNDDGR